MLLFTKNENRGEDQLLCDLWSLIKTDIQVKIREQKCFESFCVLVKNQKT